MSSFGEHVKTKIQEELSWIATTEYSENFYEDDAAKKQFMLDVLDVLRYICDD